MGQQTRRVCKLTSAGSRRAKAAHSRHASRGTGALGAVLLGLISGPAKLVIRDRAIYIRLCKLCAAAAAAVALLQGTVEAAGCVHMVLDNLPGRWGDGVKIMEKISVDEWTKKKKKKKRLRFLC